VLYFQHVPCCFLSLAVGWCHWLVQAVLESIRDSLNEQLVIPEWLVDIFLGYGDAGAAHYTQMDGLLKVVDFKVNNATSNSHLGVKY
jgi:hypothetical protein